MRPKACKVCSEKFEPAKPMQSVCSYRCAALYGRERAVKTYLVRSVKSKTKAPQKPIHAAQKAINEYVRVRDARKPCIVHGSACTATTFDAGHFRSRGSCPELSFNLRNIHSQCRPSNRGAHNRRHFKETVPGMYEANLVERIGQDRVNWLKGPHEPKQYRDEDYKRIARIFRSKARLYKRLRGMA